MKCFLGFSFFFFSIELKLWPTAPKRCLKLWLLLRACVWINCLCWLHYDPIVANKWFDSGFSLQMRLLRCQQEHADGLPTIAWSRRARTMVLRARLIFLLLLCLLRPSVRCCLFWGILTLCCMSYQG